MNDRDKLIDEAAADERDRVNAVRRMFEKAHTPTGDEREAGWSHPDAVYSLEVFGAMQELLNEANGSPMHALRIAVSRQMSEVPEPSADRVELAAATIAVAELVRSHRTWGDLLDVQKDEYRRVVREVLRATDALPAPQGEPSDAQVRAFLLEESEHQDWGYDGTDDLPYCSCGQVLAINGVEPVHTTLDRHRVLAALRAAGGMR